ncbi:MAG: signal recognition particle-docking protein FtsY [Armatimonadetes bacterium]|nr:signal recognition particle-docking protein FtsY [Armatimonadota bacterium]
MSTLFDRLRAGLARTREAFTARLDQVLAQPLSRAVFDELEAALIEADVGVPTASAILDRLRARRDVRDARSVRGALREIILELLGEAAPLRIDPPPAAIIMLGVNGVGKTTTIGKLAHHLSRQGKRVLLAAADTFRAAAIDQLAIWAQRVGCEIVRHAPGADPAAVVFDAIAALRARAIDVLIADTAGRLHTKVNLMEELKKINRVVAREMADRPVERLLVLDASTGQNAIAQARTFKDAVEVTGLVLAKLDGTAKGGVVIAIAHELAIPVKLIGTGETLDDLQPFDPRQFVDALLPPTP